MSDPWLSVLMPIHKGAATLPDTLASLFGQRDGVEVIAVVQDGSDGSRDLLLRAGVTVIDAPDSQSWMENTNIALSAARAPLVTMLHQDDLWRPGRAEALRQMAEAHPNAALYLHAADYVDATGARVGRAAPPFGRKARLIDGQEALRHLLVQNTVALPAAMFRRDTALKLGALDPDLWYTADWDLWLRLAQAGPIAWDPRALAAFRIHGGSLTLTGSRDAQGFRAQLAAPVARHLKALPEDVANRVGRLADLSNALNAALAGRFHDQQGAGLGRIALRLLALGPTGWHAFLRDTNILGRVLPRLKLKTN
ncbi:glycosyltransferase [Mesobacterium pallidum]|uniref:glycosyltransferase n=1 Tax=Mesobacterium pallidum TaxID=2872037 RepID=UPI001EE2309F|nr:glycosyltransferase [Mesobacterium pallidum]